MMPSENDNKQAKVLNDLASFYVSNSNFDFSLPGTSVEVTPPSSDSEQEPPAEQAEPSVLPTFFVKTQDVTSRRRKNHSSRKLSSVAIAMASVETDRRRTRRGPMSSNRLGDLVESEEPLKGDDDIEEGSSALERLKRLTLSVERRRVERSKSDDLVEMDSSRRTQSQDLRRQTRRRNNVSVDVPTEDVLLVQDEVKDLRGESTGSALAKLKARSTSIEPTRVAPGRTQSDDLMEVDRNRRSHSQDARRRPRRRNTDSDESLGDDATNIGHNRTERLKDKEDTAGELQILLALSGSGEQKLVAGGKNKSDNEKGEMDTSRRSHSQEGRRRARQRNDEGVGVLAEEFSQIQDQIKVLRGESERSALAKLKARSASIEPTRIAPGRSQSDDLMEGDRNQRSHSQDARRRPHRRNTDSEESPADDSVHAEDINRTERLKGGEDIACELQNLLARCEQKVLVDDKDKADDLTETDRSRRSENHDARRRGRRRNMKEEEILAENVAQAEGMLKVGRGEVEGSALEKLKVRSSSNEQRRVAPGRSKSDDLLEVDHGRRSSSQDARRRTRRRNTEGGDVIAGERPENQDAKFSNDDCQEVQQVITDVQPSSFRSKSSDREMDTSRRSSGSGERRRRRCGTNSSTENNGEDKVVKPLSDSSLGSPIRRSFRSTNDEKELDKNAMLKKLQDATIDSKERNSLDRNSKSSSSHTKWSGVKHGMDFINKAKAQVDEGGKKIHRSHRDRRTSTRPETSSAVSSSGRDEQLSRSSHKVDRAIEIPAMDKAERSEIELQPSPLSILKELETTAVTLETNMQDQNLVETPVSDQVPSQRFLEMKGSGAITSAIKVVEQVASTSEEDNTDKLTTPTFKSLLGAKMMKKSPSNTSSSDESGNVLEASDADELKQASVQDRSEKQSGTKSSVFKKLLAASSAAPSGDMEACTKEKKNKRWGGLRSGVDFTSRLLRSAGDKKKSNDDVEKNVGEEASDRLALTGKKENNADDLLIPPSKDGVHNLPLGVSKKDELISEDHLVARGSNLPSDASDGRAEFQQESSAPQRSDGRRHEEDDMPVGGALVIEGKDQIATSSAVNLFSIIEGGSNENLVPSLQKASLQPKSIPAGDRRSMLTSLAAPSIRFDADRNTEKIFNRAAPDTIQEENDEDEEEDSELELVEPRITDDSAMDEKQKDEMADSDTTDGESDDELATFLSPLKCIQLKFRPTYSPSVDLRVLVHELDNDNATNENQDDSVRVHRMIEDGFDFDYEALQLSSDDPVDGTENVAEGLTTCEVDVDASKKREMEMEYESLRRGLEESASRVKAYNDAVRSLREEIQKQTKIYEETKMRSQVLKRLLQEQNNLLEMSQ